MQPNYDAEYNLNTSSDLNYRFEIESCCNLTGNPRDLHVTQAGGFGFFLETRGRVRFLAFRDVESQCILDGFVYRLMLPVHVGASFDDRLVKIKFPVIGKVRDARSTCEFVCLPN